MGDTVLGAAWLLSVAAAATLAAAGAASLGPTVFMLEGSEYVHTVWLDQLLEGVDAGGDLPQLSVLMERTNGTAPAHVLPGIALVPSGISGTVGLRIHASNGTAGGQFRAVLEAGNAVNATLDVAAFRPCQMSPWTNWTACTEYCDGGSQFRNRSVLSPAVGSGAPSCGTTSESRTCNLVSCALSPSVELALAFQGVDPSGTQEKAAVAAALADLFSLPLLLVTVQGVQADRTATQPNGVAKVRLGFPHTGGVSVTKAIDTITFFLSPQPEGLARRLQAMNESGALAGAADWSVVVDGYTVLREDVDTNNPPVAISRLVQVPEESGELVIELVGSDEDGDELAAVLLSGLLTSDRVDTAYPGTLHHTSQVFDTYGYAPLAGEVIVSNQSRPIPVQSRRPRVVAVTDREEQRTLGLAGDIAFALSDGDRVSNTAHIWMVPAHGCVVQHLFHTGAEGWRMRGNGDVLVGEAAAASMLRHEAFHEGPLSRYIVGADHAINTGNTNRKSIAVAGQDAELWYFEAPRAAAGSCRGALGNDLCGDVSSGLGGTLEFDLGALEGDFAALTSLETHRRASPLVLLECDMCLSGNGITIGWRAPLESLAALGGGPGHFRLPLHGRGGWLLKPHILRAVWEPVTDDCTIQAVLQQLSGLWILGDLTTGFESMMLDNVVIKRADGDRPVPERCARQSIPEP